VKVAMSILTRKMPEMPIGWSAKGDTAHPDRSIGLLLLALFTLLGLVVPRLAIEAIPSLASPPITIWDSKPVLGYFVLTQSLAESMQREGVLNEHQFQVVRQVALQERDQLNRLEASTLPVIQDSQLTLDAKRTRIDALGYNRQVDAIVEASRLRLQLVLDRKGYSALSAWMARRWEEEVALHGIASQKQGLSAAKSTPRSFKIYATRYDSGGKYAVALPDLCLKFSNAGNKMCASKGYQTNKGYSVYLSYDGATGAEVWESGPWNVEDNYWSSSRDPQPRRMFADLAVGMPEAQAAFFNGYNGGVDQYGRKVTAPFGIDLARKVSIDIGLKPGNNDWITVSYMWTEGWGSSKQAQAKASPTPSGGGVPATAGPSPTPRPTNTPTPTKTPRIEQTSTPNPDGSIVHIVQPGEALWSIAVLYKISLSQIYTLNGLTESSIIIPGEKLVIQQADRTLTPTVDATATLTPTLTIAPTRPRPTASSTPAEIDGVVTPTLSGRVTPTATAGSGTTRGLDPMLVIIAIVAVLGTALLLGGSLLRRR
jgi:LysM repeat protein